MTPSPRRATVAAVRGISEEREDLRRLDVETLKRACTDGDLRACEELDRRGVEPDVVPPEPPPVP